MYHRESPTVLFGFYVFNRMSHISFEICCINRMPCHKANIHVVSVEQRDTFKRFEEGDGKTTHMLLAILNCLSRLSDCCTLVETFPSIQFLYSNISMSSILLTYDGIPEG